jgi:3-oxoacyl-[acyl-carrier-protein] synthase III
MPNAYISGTGFYVPPRVVTNDDLRNVYGIDTTHDWIVQRTGIEERRFADEGPKPPSSARGSTRPIST